MFSGEPGALTALGPYLGDVLKDEGKTDADVEKLYQEILDEFAKLNE